MTQRTMILIGQSIEAFGCIIICGDVSALGKGYMIALTGVGCACFGLSQCVVSITDADRLKVGGHNCHTYCIIQ